MFYLSNKQNVVFKSINRIYFIVNKLPVTVIKPIDHSEILTTPVFSILAQTMDWDLKYGELSKDLDFVSKCDNLKEDLMGVQKVLDQLLPLKAQYDKLPLAAQIELDLLLAFMLNSLHWVNLRIQGVDPTKHPIKGELQRIKATMLKWQQVKDRDKRPTVNLPVAKRFVRSGLYDHNNGTPLNKKIRFEDSDE